MEIKFYAQTHKGKRYNNEDAVVAVNLGGGNYFFAVADGIGDDVGGEVASSVSLYMMEKRLKHFVAQSKINESNLKQTMVSLFEAAKDAICQFVEIQPDLKGMGTTITAMLFHGNKYVWGQVGDSRLYMIKNDLVTRLTRDHTLAEDFSYLSNGNKIPIHTTPNNQLTRKIDSDTCNPDIYPIDMDYAMVEENMGWLICSDGLIVDRRKDFKELFNNIKLRPDSLHCVSTSMVKTAIKNGATGNISLVAVATGN